jgi:hypothetical protein
VNYRIVEERSRYELQDAVKKLIKDGWVPQGGVVFAPHSGWKETWAQAMVKNDE